MTAFEEAIATIREYDPTRAAALEAQYNAEQAAAEVAARDAARKAAESEAAAQEARTAKAVEGWLKNGRNGNNLGGKAI